MLRNQDAECITRYLPARDETIVHFSEGAKVLTRLAFVNCEHVTEIHLPSTMKMVCSGAFDGCPSLKSVTLPDTRACINAGAFADCLGRIEEIIIPDNFVPLRVGKAICTEKKYYQESFKMNHIRTDWENRYDYSGDEIDKFCYALEVQADEYGDGMWDFRDENCFHEAHYGVPIRYEPNEYTMKSDIFGGLEFLTELGYLEKITVSERHPFYTMHDGVLFDKNLKSLIFVPPSVKTLILPASCKALRGRFYNYFCDLFGSSSLTEIGIDPENPYFSVYDGALYDKSLKCLKAVPSMKNQIQFPASLRRIDEYAFHGSSIQEIAIPENIEFIGKWAFSSYSVVHFKYHGREIRLPVEICPHPYHEIYDWKTDEEGNWLILKLMQTRNQDEAWELFQQQEECHQDSLILDMCECWPDSQEFRELFLSMSEELTEKFVERNELINLRRLLMLNGISRECASEWIQKANQLKKYEVQMQFMHYVSSTGTDSADVMNRLSLD